MSDIIGKIRYDLIYLSCIAVYRTAYYICISCHERHTFHLILRVIDADFFDFIFSFIADMLIDLQVAAR